MLLKHIPEFKEQFRRICFGRQASNAAPNFFVLPQQRFDQKTSVRMGIRHEWEKDSFLGTKMTIEIAREEISQLFCSRLQSLDARRSNLSEGLFPATKRESNPAVVIFSKTAQARMSRHAPWTTLRSQIREIWPHENGTEVNLARDFLMP